MTVQFADRSCFKPQPGTHSVGSLKTSEMATPVGTKTQNQHRNSELCTEAVALLSVRFAKYRSAGFGSADRQVVTSALPQPQSYHSFGRTTVSVVPLFRSYHSFGRNPNRPQLFSSAGCPRKQHTLMVRSTGRVPQSIPQSSNNTCVDNLRAGLRQKTSRKTGIGLGRIPQLPILLRGRRRFAGLIVQGPVVVEIGDLRRCSAELPLNFRGEISPKKTDATLIVAAKISSEPLHNST